MGCFFFLFAAFSPTFSPSSLYYSIGTFFLLNFTVIVFLYRKICEVQRIIEKRIMPWNTGKNIEHPHRNGFSSFFSFLFYTHILWTSFCKSMKRFAKNKKKEMKNGRLHKSKGENKSRKLLIEIVA